VAVSLGVGRKRLGGGAVRISYVKGFKVFSQSDLQGGKNEWGLKPKQWKLKLQKDINNTRFQVSSVV
jgi:hypothetical protein